MYPREAGTSIPLPSKSKQRLICAAVWASLGHKSKSTCPLWPALKPVTCKSTADTQVKCREEDLTRGTYSTRTHTPDASHASSFRAELASLQLTGNNLSFGFQLPGQTFKLQLLETERVTDRKAERGGRRMCQNNLSIYLQPYLQSFHSKSHFGSNDMDTFLIVEKWTLQSVVGKQAKCYKLHLTHTNRLTGSLHYQGNTPHYQSLDRST